MGFTSDACWFLPIKNNKKREAALKNEAGGDEKHVFFFTWPSTLVCFSMKKSILSQSQLSRIGKFTGFLMEHFDCYKKND